MKEGPWSPRQSAKEASHVCTTLHMLVLEEKQRFHLKAAKGSVKGFFMVSMVTKRFPPAPHNDGTSTLPLFIALDYSQRRKEITSLGCCSLVIKRCALTCGHGCFTTQHNTYTLAASGVKGGNSWPVDYFSTPPLSLYNWTGPD